MHILANPHLLLTVTTLIWAGNAIAGKFALGHVSPMVLTMGRWGIAFVIIAVIAREQIQKDWPTIKKHWLYFLLMGGIGYTAFNAALYSAAKYTTAINITLEQSAMPIIIFALNFLIYRTRITWVQLVGYSLTLLGVLVTVSAGDFVSLFDNQGAGINRGDIIMFFAALFYGGYSVGLSSKPTMHWQSFLAALIGAAFICSIVGVAFEHHAGDAQFPSTTQGFLVMLFTGIFPSLVSQGFFIKGVEAFGANIAGLYINLVPVFGALLAVLLLGEQLHIFHAVAFVLVVGGILIAQRQSVVRRSKPAD